MEARRTPRSSARRDAILGEPEGRVLAGLAGPMVLAILANSGIGVVDAWVVGRMGSAELSAVGFAYPVLLVLTNVAMGVALGAGTVAARALGASADLGGRRAVTSAALLGLLLAVVLAVAGLATVEPAFRRLGAEPGLVSTIAEYMRIVYLGLPFTVLSLVATSALRSTGDARGAAGIVLLGAALNAALDPVLVLGWGGGPRLGVAGAAWAALAARAVVTAAAFAALAREGLLARRPPSVRELLAEWRAVAAVGVPAAIAKLAFPVSMLAVTGLVAAHGAPAVAALGLASRVETLLLVGVVALATALLPFVGQNWGAGRLDRVRRGVDLAVRFSFGWGALLAVVLLPAAPSLATHFSDDPRVVEATTLYFRAFAFSYAFQGISAMMSSAFNAAERPLWASAVTLARMFVLYLPLAWLGDRLWGLPGLFAGGSLATVLTGAGAWVLGRRIFGAAPAVRAVGAVAALTALALLGKPAGAAEGAPRTARATDFGGNERFTIMQIQGDDVFSPLKDQVVVTTGVVTLVAGDGSGFWIQDSEGDGDAATSDGLLVRPGERPANERRPTAGDLVRVTGRVEEEHRGIALPRTRMVEVIELEVLDSGRSLPEPAPIGKLPDVDLEAAAAFWEALEGMRVSLASAIVVGPTNRIGDIALLADANAVPGSGFYVDSSVLVIRPLGGDLVDYNPERVVVGAGGAAKRIEAAVGDRVTGLVGVVDCLGGAYKIQPERLELARGGPAPAAPVSRRSGPPGDVRIVDLNMASLFDTVDEPDRFDENWDPPFGSLGTPSAEEVDRRIEKFALAVVIEMELPDILLAQEFETTELLQAVGDRVNARAGTRYRALSRQTSDRRGLEVGFLYDEARVELVRADQLAGPEFEVAFGMTSAFRNREPLMSVFRLSPGGPELTIVVNKGKSKRGEPPLPNLNRRPGRFTEPQRKLQARVLRGWVDRLLAADSRALVLVAGDFGDFQFPEPGEGEHAIGILEGGPGAVRLENLLGREAEAERYTWLLQGNGQALSHMLASPALAKRCVGVDVLHFNAGFPEWLRNDRTTPLRATDRDPIEGRFALRTGR